MFKRLNGEVAFDQWELNQLVTNDSMVAGDRVRFVSANGETGITYAREADGKIVADVPNELLRVAMPITVQLGDGASWKCEHKTTFAVNPAEMPGGYECTDNTWRPDPNAHTCTGGGVTSWDELEDKPFGEEIGTVTLFSEEEVLIEACDTGNICFDFGTLVLGSVYTVTVDGTSREVECTYNDDYGAQHQLVIDSDLTLYQEVGSTDLRGSNGLRESRTFALSIACPGKVVKPLDPKYLPEGYPYEEMSIIPGFMNVSVTTSGAYASYDFGTNYDGFEVDRDVYISVDGVEHKTTKGTMSNGTGWDDTYYRTEDKSIMVVKDAATGVWYVRSDIGAINSTISVYAKETTIHPLAEKFLPDSVKGGGAVPIINDETIDVDTAIAYAKQLKEFNLYTVNYYGTEERVTIARVNAYRVSYQPADGCCSMVEGWELEVLNGGYAISSYAISQTQYNEIKAAWAALAGA